MAISNEELLQKATMSSSDFGGGGEAPLAIQQVTAFLRLAITPTVMLSQARTVTHSAPKWQESKIDFASRIMRPGTQGERLTSGNRVKPTTGLVEMDTVLIRGEVPVSDEVFEDQVEGQGFGATILAQLALAVGRDIEELYIQGDLDSADAYLALLKGWLERVEDDGNSIDSTSDAQDYQTIFRKLLGSIDPKNKCDPSLFRYFVPTILDEKYRDQVADRGTPLGDAVLQGLIPMRYAGTPIVPVPLIPVTSGSPDTSKILFTNPLNLYAGFQRQIRIETFRDPREGAISYVVTMRGDAQVAVPEAASLAYSVSVE